MQQRTNLDDEEGMALKEDTIEKLRMNFSSRKSRSNTPEAASERVI